MARRFRIERFLGTVLLAVLLAPVALISMPRWISATESSDPLPVLPHASDGFNESIDEVDTGIEQGEEPDGGSRRSLRSSAPLASSGASQITAEQRAAIEHRIIVAATGLEDRVEISDLGVTLHTDSQEDMDLIFVLLDEAVQDDPDLFYLCCNLFARIHPSGSTTMTAIGLRYSFPKDDIPAMRETYEAAMQEMLAWIPDGASDLERIRAVHDYLRTEVSYDNDVEESTVSEMIADGSILSYTPYAALVDREDGSRKAVCQGYALAFSAAMRRLGIPCIYVKQDVTVQDSSGLHSERHAWNRVQLDGNWYSVDTTWDSVNNSYRYLLKSDEWWISHPDSRGFHSAWSPSDAPAGTDTTYDSYGFGDPYTGPTEHATVTGFQLSDSAIGLDPEEEYQLAIVGVTPVGASTVDVSWTSSDPGIVIVDSAGRLYATMEEGTAIITCTIDGIPRSCTVNVGTAGPDDPGVLVPKPTSRTVRNNGTEQAGYSAEFLDERYTIGGDTVGSSAGTYTSVFSLIDPGNTAWEDGTTDDFVLVWEILPAPVVSIGVDGKQTMLIGQTQTLSVRIAPAYADNTAVSWKSSDTAIATVDANGKVTAEKAGTATITATAEDGSGKSGSIEITVNSGSVSYRTHVQDAGWQTYVSDGTMSGTSGRSLRLEGINIRLSNIEGGIRYRTHIQDIGWQEWRTNGAMSGTSGRSLRLEAIEIELTGKAADAYDIYYRVHAQDFGWMGWAKNGASAGTANYSYRLEGIQIVLVPKGGAAPSASYQDIKSNTATCFSDRIAPGTINYTTHVQDVGWQPYVCDGAMSGTSGRSLRLEGILINLSGIDGGVRYRTHVQDIGWQGWRADNAMSGTSGQSLRLEAIQIKLTGKAAEDYDIYYRVHCENIGWMGWAKNGQSAGSAGFGYRLEGIQIVLVPKGGKAPGASCQGITQDASERFVQG